MLSKDISSVIEWNAFSLQGQHDFSEKKIEAQRKFTSEEVNETIKAIQERDIIKFIDGLCDIFVTSVYYEFIRLPHLYDPMMGLLHTSGKAIKYSNGERIEQYVHDMANDKTMDTSFWFITSIYKSLHDTVRMSSLMESVMQSNWSKFPMLVSLPHSVDDECALIESKYKCLGVYATVSNLRGVDCVIFRDDAGKIRKPPSSFFEPSFEISEVEKMAKIMGY